MSNLKFFDISISLPVSKVYIFLVGFCFFSLPVVAQDQKLADSLSRLYYHGNLSDTAKYKMLIELSFNETSDLIKGLNYAEELIRLAQTTGKENYLRIGYFLKGNKKRALDNKNDALDAYFKSAEIARKINNLKGEGEVYGAIADVYAVDTNYNTAMHYYHQAINILRQSNDSISLASVLSNAGDALLKTNNYDSALHYFGKSKEIFDKEKHETGIAYSLGNIGMVYAKIGKNQLAEKNINQAISMLEKTQDYYPVCVYLVALSDMYLIKGDIQTALRNTLRSLQLAQQYGLNKQIADANFKLSEIYEKTGNLDKAFIHYKSYIGYRDSANNIASVQKTAELRSDYEISQKQLEVNIHKKQLIALAIILGLTIILIAILIKNNRDKHKAFKVLNLQRQKTNEQKAKVEAALDELQITQQQLIQSAKMASMGELTAGIAHEIQNPLNFVNNFSEVSVELLTELREGALSTLTSTNKAETEKIIKDLAGNLEKIRDHGKRADSIVKGMLQHSRASATNKESVDINALVEEYLRLSYHGFRAKDNTFNITFEKSFDNSLAKVLVVPQDIGRVLINIFNNAFFSVLQKTKLKQDGFEPTLWVTTESFAENGKLKCVQIRIKDNGLGISDKILDKIYQPFFTTKPTGQGTGLGLSLSYDIIKNEHNGVLKVETQAGQYATFIIELPY